MIIVFKGNDALDLTRRLQEWTGKDEASTLNFLLRNFEIPSEKKENDAAGMVTVTSCGTAHGHIR